MNVTQTPTSSDNLLAEIEGLIYDLDLSTQEEIVNTVFVETGHQSTQATISRLLKGNTSDALLYFVRNALSKAFDRKREERDLEAGVIGIQEHEPDSETRMITYFVKASSNASAIKTVSSLGYDVTGNYDLTRGMETAGQWLAKQAKVERIETMGCYAVTMNWYLDV